MNTEPVELSDFGQQLRELRARAGFSRAELARAVRISESTVKALELGQRSPSSAVRSALLAALGQLDQAAESAAVLNCWIAPGFSPLAMLANVQATVNGPGGSLEQSALGLRGPRYLPDWSGRHDSTSRRKTAPLGRGSLASLQRAQAWRCHEKHRLGAAR